MNFILAKIRLKDVTFESCNISFSGKNLTPGRGIMGTFLDLYEFFFISMVFIQNVISITVASLGFSNCGFQKFLDQLHPHP